MQPFSQVAEQFKMLRADVDRQGYAILQTHVTPEGCEYLKNLIKQFPEKDAEINYAGTEKRIWGLHCVDPVMRTFSLFSDHVMSSVFNSQSKVKTVLAYSNFPVLPEQSVSTGRWHIDSLRHQYKLFCFLTQTEEQTGPLELVPGTHRAAFKFRALMSGQYISLWNLRNGKRSYQRLSEQWAETQCRKAGGSVPLLCKAGTIILVDTSAIHRARPCIEGNRYALATYYDHL